MKKEIPILFSTLMVQAILEGRKTQTRRLSGLDVINKDPNNYLYLGTVMIEEVLHFSFHDIKNDVQVLIKSKYGKPGDILWVRETWQFWSDRYQYKADQDKLDEIWKCPLKWKPSIHMPKEATRIWLEVEEVRVERLQDITEEDSMCEGVQPNCTDKENCPSISCKEECQSKGEYFHYMRGFEDFPAFSAKESFESLWEKINGRQSWDANPWVWVIKFKVLSTTGKPE